MKNNIPAFPIQDAYSMSTEQGMTLRDYFAAKAMQTYMISEVWTPDTFKAAAINSYKVADAMMKVREA